MYCGLDRTHTELARWRPDPTSATAPATPAPANPAPAISPPHISTPATSVPATAFYFPATLASATSAHASPGPATSVSSCSLAPSQGWQVQAPSVWTKEGSLLL